MSATNAANFSAAQPAGVGSNSVSFSRRNSNWFSRQRGSRRCERQKIQRGAVSEPNESWLCIDFGNLSLDAGPICRGFREGLEKSIETISPKGRPARRNDSPDSDRARRTEQRMRR